MCALENPASTDDATIARARDSLQSLLSSPSPGLELVTEAVDSLQALRERLATARRRRAALREAAGRRSAAASAAAAHTERLDSEIIQAKLQAGELLTVRDSVARDLARARRTLARLDALAEEGERGGGGRDAVPAAGNTESDGMVGRGWEVGEGGEEDVDELVQRVADEMERMRIAEKTLVEVVDEINAIKKRRSELQEKVKVAQEEW